MLILLIIDTDNDRFPAHFIFIRKKYEVFDWLVQVDCLGPVLNKPV